MRSNLTNDRNIRQPDPSLLASLRKTKSPGLNYLPISQARSPIQNFTKRESPRRIGVAEHSEKTLKLSHAFKSSRKDSAPIASRPNHQKLFADLFKNKGSLLVQKPRGVFARQSSNNLLEPRSPRSTSKDRRLFTEPALKPPRKKKDFEALAPDNWNPADLVNPLLVEKMEALRRQLNVFILEQL